ncbi:hypothetical protein ACFQMA_22920 [Halosimplex aquaticum]|uniref:DUF8074 domain-containing protein n=1 Tax=Halosimplex aquaticum TaxID=3026162 RepID=A0ABD5Y5K5_9EURY|nr:hypothetical protein [Halosimplex aquaticum]
MELTSQDGAVLIYTFGVMVSALWLSTPGNPKLTPVVVALFGVVSIGWTAYFKWRIAPQYEEDDEEEEDEEEDLTPPTVEN